MYKIPYFCQKYQIMIIDTHTHIFVSQFDTDRAEVIQRAKDVGVEKFVLPNIDKDSINQLKKTVKEYPDEMLPLMGLHPTSVKDNWQDELAVIKQELDTGNYYGVGEIGIDLYWDKTFVKQQKQVFETQLQWAKEKKLPVSIHIREAFDEVFEIVEQEKSPDLRGIFHCFTGNKQQALRAVDLGFHLGIGGVVTFKNGKIDKFLNEIPLHHLVVETDAPWLAPTPYRGKRNEPAYIDLIVQKLSEIYQMKREELECILYHNSMDVFDFA
jgi:TatD DNase family protein